MPTVRYAHLLLPSPQGLLEYDILEDAVFVGPGPRGGLSAQPSPFPSAKIALTRSESGFAAKPLPGEDAPQINGETLADAVLSDGDRIRIGDQVVLFRTDRGPVRAAPAAAAAAITRPATRSSDGARSGGESRAKPRRSAGLWSLIGAAILLAATVRAVGHLKAMQEARDSRVALPDTPKVMEQQASRAELALRAIRAFERDHPDRISRAVERYQGFVKANGTAAESEIAQERVRELMDRWGKQEALAVAEQVDRMILARQFNRAARVVREFEERFGATRSGAQAEPLHETIRTAAKEALTELSRMARVLIDKNPAQAVNLLAGAGLAYPADMAVEIADLLGEARRKARAERGRRGPRRRPKSPPKDPDGGNKGDADPAPKDAEPKPDDVPGPDSGDSGPPPGENAEILAKQAWARAHEDLTNAAYNDALLGYTLLIQRYGKTDLYKSNRSKIQAGLSAARVGTEGPKALLQVPAVEKKGRLEFEYTFNTMQELEDWNEEQPFASEKLVDIKYDRGAVSMAGTSGLIHPMVFLPDVRIEANVTADVAHDFGLIAIEESDDYRAVLFNVNNSRFKLKKGDNKKPNPGHLLWYVGQGVWSAADADAFGYIKIAERGSSKVKDGDRMKLELERSKGDRCEAGFGSANDGVHLKGTVKGDDGSTMGNARVGVFVDTGIVRVHQIKISGRVDMQWFKQHLEWLAKGDPGPK